jgi:hypothetical protein
MSSVVQHEQEHDKLNLDKSIEKKIKRAIDKIPKQQSFGGGGGVEEAPTDGKTYGRNKGKWTEVTESTGGGAVDSVNGETGVVVLDAADVGAESAGAVSTHETTYDHDLIATALQEEADPFLMSLGDDMLDFSGMVDPDNLTVSYDSSTRKITVTHSSGTIEYYFRNQKKTLSSPWVSSAHDDTNGMWFLYSTDGTNFAWSTTPWVFHHTMIAYVNYGATDKWAQRENHGLMPWQNHTQEHDLDGTYRKSGGGLTAGTYALQSDADADITMGFDEALVKDEDLSTTIPAWTQGTYTTIRLSGSAVATFDTTATLPYRVTGTYPNYNSVTGVTWGETEMANGDYFNVYQILLPATSDTDSQKYRVLLLQPQAKFSTKAGAEAEDFRSLNLGNLTNLSPEFVAYVRLTFRLSASYVSTGKARIESISYLTGSRQSQVAVNGFTPTDHSSLTGRSELDQHPIGAITDLQTSLDAKVAKTGGTMTGKLTLDSPPLSQSDEVFTGTGLDDCDIAGSYTTVDGEDATFDVEIESVQTGTELLANPDFETTPATGGGSTGNYSTTVARTTNVATVVFATPHLLANNDVVTLTAFTDTTFNGTNKVVTVVNSTTITYASTGTNKATTADTTGRLSTDVFSSWSEVNGNGQVFLDTSAPQTGSNCVGIITGASSSSSIYQQPTVVPYRQYTATFYAKGDGTYAGRYEIYDVTNAVSITGVITTGVTANSWTQVTKTVIAPAGCVSIRLRFYSSATTGVTVYFDNATLQQDSDTFKWRKNDEDYAILPITGAAQTLKEGITATFGATTGHTVGDKWSISIDFSDALELRGVDDATLATLKADGSLITEGMIRRKYSETDIYPNGNSGASKTIDLKNGEYQSIILTAATVNLSFLMTEKYTETHLLVYQDATGGRILDAFVKYSNQFLSASDVDTTNNCITVDADIPTGERCRLWTGTAPTGLVVATTPNDASTYWTIRYSATQVQFAASPANAMAGTAIDLTAVGSGNPYFHTLHLCQSGFFQEVNSVPNSMTEYIIICDGTKLMIKGGGSFY